MLNMKNRYALLSIGGELAFALLALSPLLVCEAVLARYASSNYETTEGKPMYLDPAAPIQKRVDDLLSKMTMEEKIAQLAAVYNGGHLSDYTETGVGWTVFPGSAASRNAMQKTMMESSRLHLPIAFTQESLHSSTEGGTIFPVPVHQGCSWNTSLIHEIASTIALEASSVGIDIGFTPVINMFTDPRFGRHSEGFSENPTLSALYAKAAVLAYQGDNGTGAMTYLDNQHIVSLAKHYAAYGNAAGGQNAAPSHIDMQTLFDVYLKPWQSFANHGGRGAMASHQTVDHLPCHGNPWLVNTVFRKQLGFGNGSVVSDCNDIAVLAQYRIADNSTHAAAKGLLGGVDIDLMCGANSAMHSYDKLSQALSDGLIAEADIDTAAGHILAGKFALRLFDEPLVNESAPYLLNTSEHRQLAYEAALQGMTLVKRPVNSWPPISKQSGVVVAVIGPNGGCEGEQTALPTPDSAEFDLEAEQENIIFRKVAVSSSESKTGHCDAQTNMAGPYSRYGAVDISTVTAYLREKLGTAATVGFARGCEIDSDRINATEMRHALDLAAYADYIVLVVGDSLHSYGEWSDRDTLDLPGGQLELMSQVKSVAKPNATLIAVVTSGGPVTFGESNAVLDMMDYVLVAWRSGQMGGVAIGDVVLGDAEPSGRLAQGWPRSVGQVNAASSPWLQQIRGKWLANVRGDVVDPDGRRYDPYVNSPSTPLFQFGYGLSLSQFKYDNLQAVKTGNDKEPLMVSVDVSNVGGRDATEVVQFYVQDPVLPWVPYWKRLLAFDKIFLKKGEMSTVSQVVDFINLALYDTQLDQRIMPGQYTIRVGNSSTTDTLTTIVTFQ